MLQSQNDRLVLFVDVGHSAAHRLAQAQVVGWIHDKSLRDLRLWHNAHEPPQEFDYALVGQNPVQVPVHHLPPLDLVDCLNEIPPYLHQGFLPSEPKLGPIAVIQDSALVQKVVILQPILENLRGSHRITQVRHVQKAVVLLPAVCHKGALQVVFQDLVHSDAPGGSNLKV